MNEDLLNMLRIILGKDSFTDVANIASELRRFETLGNNLSATLDELYSKVFVMELKAMRDILIDKFDDAIDAVFKKEDRLPEISDDEIREL